ncbi:hypothetical protein M9X92_011928 [Pyricularia oryzae]|nr:hypothetical protein M9X92_011928 [Pyricularia oryzae]
MSPPQGTPFYRGTARIKLNCLYCNWNDLNQYKKRKNKKAISQYNVSAIINNGLLETAIELSNISRETLFSFYGRPLTLDLPRLTILKYITRRLILKATKGTNKEWWVVKFYTKENTYSLGWIFQQIFISRSQKDQTLEKQWKSLFSKHKKRYLTYVISEKLKSRFQALLKIPGLWHQSPFGNMHKVEAMKCVEESSHYLDQILSIFTSFVRGQTQLLGSIDSYTVAALEGKCPGLSKHDRLRLESLLESGKLLPRASSENRQLFIDAVCEFKRQIPSLGTFFNDMRYLEGCARYIKQLVKVERDSTVRQTDTDFHKRPASAVEEQFDIAQRQLWLCAMRKSLMSPVGPQNQQALLAKSKRPSEDPVSLRQLALVARRLGFHSSRIYQLASGDPHTEIAAETLLGIQQQSNYPNEGGSLQPALETTVDVVQEGVETQSALQPFVTRKGNGDESHVQDVAVAVRILMSDWHPYDASSGSGLSIDDCFQSAINNSGKILMRRVY